MCPLKCHLYFVVQWVKIGHCLVWGLRSAADDRKEHFCILMMKCENFLPTGYIGIFASMEVYCTACTLHRLGVISTGTFRGGKTWSNFSRYWRKGSENTKIHQLFFTLPHIKLLRDEQSYSGEILHRPMAPNVALKTAASSLYSALILEVLKCFLVVISTV